MKPATVLPIRLALPLQHLYQDDPHFLVAYCEHLKVLYFSTGSQAAETLAADKVMDVPAAYDSS